MLINFKPRTSLLCHSLGKGNPDSSSEKLDSRSPRAGATSVDDLRGNDRGGYSTKNLSLKTHHLKSKNGFVMLFSVLVSSLLVTIGLSIFNLTLKEITLSTAGRESQIAFYAANSGMECALYWDLKGDGTRGAFASNKDDKDGAAYVGAECNDSKINNSGNVSESYDSSATTKFSFNIDEAGNNTPCVNVTVKKKTETEAVSGKTIETTTIESQGNNICVGGRRVQRGLQSTMVREL